MLKPWVRILTGATITSAYAGFTVQIGLGTGSSVTLFDANAFGANVNPAPSITIYNSSYLITINTNPSLGFWGINISNASSITLKPNEFIQLFSNGLGWCIAGTVTDTSLYPTLTGVNSFSGVTTHTANLVVNGGYVGIGLATPAFPLDVFGNVAGTSYGTTYQILYSSQTYNSTTNIPSGGANLAVQNIAVNVNNGIRATHYVATSDSRLKREITTLDSNTTMNQLRSLRPVSYRFKDILKNSSNLQHGFIAQEIQSIIPSATTSVTEFISNIFDMVTVNNNIITFTKFKTDDLDKDSNGFLFSTIKLYDSSDNEIITTIINVIDSSSCQIADSINSEKCFVYGQKVDNSLSIDKNVIFTITTSAVQYLDQLVQNQQKTIDDLQNQIKLINAKLSLLEVL